MLNGNLGEAFFHTMINIHSHDNPEGLEALLSDCLSQRIFGRASVFIWNSGQTEIQSMLPGIRMKLPNPPVFGSGLYQPIFDQVRKERPAKIYFLSDDIRLCDDFLERSRANWDGISDQNKGALRYSGKIGGVLSSFFAPLDFFEALDFYWTADCEPRARASGLSLFTDTLPPIVEAAWERMPLHA